MCTCRVFAVCDFYVLSTVTSESYIVQGSIHIHMYAIQWRIQFFSLSSGDALSEFCELNAAFLITLLNVLMDISAWTACIKGQFTCVTIVFRNDCRSFYSWHNTQFRFSYLGIKWTSCTNCWILNDENKESWYYHELWCSSDSISISNSSSN